MKNLGELSIMNFDAFVEYGKEQGANIVNGMPWSFVFFGHQVTHENSECYLIEIEGRLCRFTRKECLCLDNGENISFINREFLKKIEESKKQ